MNPGLLVLSRDRELIQALSGKLGEQRTVIGCDDLTTLHERLHQGNIAAVLVHFDAETLGEQSPGRFVAELDEAVSDAPLYGLIGEDCPNRLRALAEKTVDTCLGWPLEIDRLDGLLGSRNDLENELDGFWRGMPHKELHGRSRSLVTFQPEMFEMLDDIRVAARHDVTCLLIGETGSGKTHLARLIHELSERREERFCTVACGSIPLSLIDSELFGHVRGAFTGADANREGKFAAAGRGTVLLDEIDVLPPEQQAKLLRVIETREYEQVGSNDTKISEARLVVASNYNLEELVQNGTFRTDLYYRLNILHFRLLPLRERPWDIEYLARKFALEHSRTHNIPLRQIEPEFFETLRRYQWPGNIREMENVIRRAVLYCQRGVLTVGDLPSSIRQPQASLRPSMGVFAGHAAATPQVGAGPVVPQRPAAGHRGPGPVSAAGGDSHSTAVDTLPGGGGGDPPTLEDRVELLERRIIEDALRRNNQRRKETAAELGISRVTLYNKMKKFGLM